MGSKMEEIMRKRREARDAEYEARWNNGFAADHPDYDPTFTGPSILKASRATEEHFHAIAKNDIKEVYAKIAEGVDFNCINAARDQTLFWGIDGGVEIIKLLVDCGADLNRRSAKDWTPLSYARAEGKYGAVEEASIHTEDVLKYYDATDDGSRPSHSGSRSPRESYDPETPDFTRERGSYQSPSPAP